MNLSICLRTTNTAVCVYGFFFIFPVLQVEREDYALTGTFIFNQQRPQSRAKFETSFYFY